MKTETITRTTGYRTILGTRPSNAITLPRTREHTYKGYRIERCAYAPREHSGRWVIRGTHPQTGLVWSDQDCAHTHTLAGARELIDQWVRAS